MTRMGVALLALMWVGPAWAGCSNWAEDGDGFLGPAPRAKICIAGACEETTLDYNCGNINTAKWGYKNGLAIDVTADNRILASRNGHKIAVRRIKCTEIDEGSCFIRP